MGGRKTGPALVVATTVVMAVVVLVLFHQGGAPVGGGDAPTYFAYARNLVDHGVFSPGAYPYPASVYRLPGYPGFVALFAAVFASPLLWLRIGQFALLAVTGLIVWRIADLVGARRAALPAALLTVTYLPLVWLSADVETEMLATTLSVLLVLIFCMLRKTGPRLWLCAGLGAVVAAATYVRPELSVFGLLLTLLLIPGFRRHVGWQRALALAAVIVAAGVIPLVPWTVRNSSVAHAFVPFGTASGDDLYASALQYSGAVSYKFTPPDFTRAAQLAVRVTGREPAGVTLAEWEVRRNTLLQHAAWRLVRSLPASKIISSVPRRLAYLWSTADYYPPTTAGRVAHKVAQAQYGLYVLLLVVGLVLGVLRDRRLWPLLLLPVYLTVLHLVSHEEPVYTVEARPLLLIMVAMAGVAVYDRLVRRTDAVAALPG